MIGLDKFQRFIRSHWKAIMIIGGVLLAITAWMVIDEWLWERCFREFVYAHGGINFDPDVYRMEDIGEACGRSN